MKIQNPFRAGLFAGLGVLVAIAIGSTVASLATVLTYVGAALFLALGLDPIVSWSAILIVLVAFGGVITGLVFAIIPVVVEQVNKAITAGTALVDTWQSGELRSWVLTTFPWLDENSINGFLTQIENWLTTLDYGSITGAITGGLLDVGVGIATGVTGAVIVFILTLYFTSSIRSLKRGMARLVPASKRPRFIELSEKISESVGRFVIGQGSLGVANGVLSSLVLGVLLPIFGLPVDYWALLAFIALLGSLIPLVGTLSAAIINTLLVLLFNGPASAIAVGVYYIIYMQVEAYVISPRIMSQAVKVPGWLVVIAAIAGGTLLGLLGALVAIPVAAAILLIINEVFIPRQDEL
jgi:predicted PurR-regulated permease PerM